MSLSFSTQSPLVQRALGSALIVGAGALLYQVCTSSSTSSPPQKSKTTMAPSSKPWADGPYKLIETPRLRKGTHDTSNEHPSCAAGSEMALVHNVMIRTVNCIHRQALNIPANDPKVVKDFMTFVYTLIGLIHIHHANEEDFFFPWLEEYIGCAKGEVMGDNVRQHHAFKKHMEAFEVYVQSIRKEGAAYDGQKLLDLMDAFLTGEEGLYIHLNDEIKTFERLESYGDKINWKEWNERMIKQAVGNANLEYHIPLFVTNCDITYEDPFNKDHWPPFPWYAMLLLRFVKIPKHKDAWQFGCCDSTGRPKELPYA